VADNAARIILSAEDKTRAAFASAKRNLDALNATAAGIGRVFTASLAPIGLLGIAISSINFSSVIDGIDRLNDIKDATGASIENISALEDVADRTGTSVDTVADALTKLNKNLTAATPGSAIEATLRGIGLSADELRALDPAEALLQVATALDKYGASGSKARTITALTGKSVQELAPFLKDLAEAGKLNATVTTKQADEAEKLNKAFFELQKNIKDAARDIAGPLAASLNRSIQKFKDYGSVIDALKDNFRFDQADDVSGNLAKTFREAEQARARLAKIGEIAQRPGISDAVRERYKVERAELEQQLNLLSRRQKYLLGQAADPTGGPAELARRGRGQETAPEPVAAAGPAPDQIGLLRRQLEGRTQAIGQSLANEQDLIRFNEQVVESIYRTGSTSLESTFHAQDELRRRNVEEIRLATEQTVQAERDFQAALPKPNDASDAARNAAEAEGSENRIDAARARLATAEREFQQVTDSSAIQRPEQREQLREQVTRFDAALQDLVDGGRSRAGELADIAERTVAAERLLIAGGVSKEEAQQRAQAFGQQLEQLRQFNLARDEFARITDRARDAEEALVLAQEQSGVGLLEGERQVFELRKQELAQLDQLIERTLALAAANPRNEAVSDDLRKLQLQRQRLAATLDPTKQRLDAAADSAAGALTDGLRDAVLEGEKLSDVIANIDKKLAGIFLEEAVFKPLQQGLGNILKGSGGQGLGENIFSFLGLGGSGTTAQAGRSAAAESAGGVGAVLKSLGVTPFNPGAGAELGDVASQVAGSAAGADSSLLGVAVAADAATQALGSLALAAGGGVGGGPTSGGGLLGALGGFFGGGSSSTPTTGDFARLDRGQSSGGGTGGFLDTAISFFASFFHDGGVAGEARGGDGRAVPAVEFFEQARRYHSGGIVGVPADAVPAVLQVGEELVAPSDPRHRDNGAAVVPGASSGAGGIVQPAAVRLPGLAPDEVPAYLPRGMEVLTADDPRHSRNAGVAAGPAALDGPAGMPEAPLAAVDRVLGLAAPGHADVLAISGHLAESVEAIGLAAPAGAAPRRAGAFADPQLLSAATSAAESLIAGDEEGDDAATAAGRPAPLGAVWDRAVRYHTGGVAGMAADRVSPLAAFEERAYAEAEPRGGDGGGGSRRTRPAVNLSYTPVAGDSRETTIQRGRELARQVQLSLRNA
jgi:hypothetical protein